MDIIPPTVFVCPLSSRSYPEFNKLHVELVARDNLCVTSYALVEHCRAISLERIVFPRIAQLTKIEIDLILHRLQVMLD